MSRSIFPTYTPVQSPRQKEYVLASLKDWSIAHGLAIRPGPNMINAAQDDAGIYAVPAPVTLYPSLFPRSCFQEGLSIQTAYNELYMFIASNETWLYEILKELITIDDFISRLWKVHLAVKQQGYLQDIALGLFRSDYMVHVNPEGSEKRIQIKQVEFNTIASSFGGLSQEVGALHKYLVRSGAYDSTQNDQTCTLLQIEALPVNESISGLAAGLASAHSAYVASVEAEGSETDRSKKCVVFVVQEPERNVFDQRKIEYALLNDHGITSFRVPFDKILEQTRLSSERKLLYEPPYMPGSCWEVTTVYLRSGYSPEEYKSESHWEARLLLESSRAIKCPTVLTQLAGSKKVQQVLSTPGSDHLENFIHDKEKVAAIRQTFAPIFPMDDSLAGREAKKLATDEASAVKYVLKPQREGGGNNIYRGKIPAFLKTMAESQWPAWILMEMIEPPALKNIIFRNGEVQEGGVIGELGVYGACLWRNQTMAQSKPEVLVNKEAGHLLRTKGDTSEEGGVAAGFGAVDSCCLVDV